MEKIDAFFTNQKPTALRPLLGLTILLVEDSLSSCEVIRLMCLRSGARIRRADCLESARRHLRVYNPSVVMIDLGLPDGDGNDLIRELAAAQPRVGVILGTSGDPELGPSALESGADGFIEKPIDNLASFQSKILGYLPNAIRPQGPRKTSTAPVPTDPLALQDDLAHALNLLEDGDDTPTTHKYLATFLAGVARTASDKELQNVARTFAHAKNMAGPEKNNLSRTLNARIGSLGQI